VHDKVLDGRRMKVCEIAETIGITECTMSLYKEMAWRWYTRIETCCQLCINWLYICCV
jgi:DNA-binding Xre family transcriptional regulator